MKMNLHKINKLLVELKQKINEKNVKIYISAEKATGRQELLQYIDDINKSL